MNTMIRSSAMASLAACAVLASYTVPAQSPDHPTKPIRLITHAPPGSSPDVVARILGERLAALLGQPIVVENRPGASGTIAVAAVAKAQPTGTDIRHIPYKGAVAATTALLGQQVDLLSTSGVAVMSQIRSGKLRPIATASPQRMPAFPEAFGTLIQSELARWAKVVREAGIRAD
jgi:tripartite-type tricarboxylate transporter receptor subunit TctC